MDVYEQTVSIEKRRILGEIRLSECRWNYVLPAARGSCCLMLWRRILVTSHVTESDSLGVAGSAEGSKFVMTEVLLILNIVEITVCYLHD